MMIPPTRPIELMDIARGLVRVAFADTEKAIEAEVERRVATEARCADRLEAVQRRAYDSTLATLTAAELMQIVDEAFFNGKPRPENAEAEAEARAIRRLGPYEPNRPRTREELTDRVRDSDGERLLREALARALRSYATFREDHGLILNVALDGTRLPKPDRCGVAGYTVRAELVRVGQRFEALDVDKMASTLCRWLATPQLPARRAATW